MKMKVFIAGQEGMVGNAVYKLLKKKKFSFGKLQKIYAGSYFTTIC